jgi:DNA primase
MIPDDAKREILNHLDMVALVGEYVALQKRGSRFWALCPFHTEKTPSFCVTPEKGVYYCFGCQRGGDLFSFVMDIEKLTFPEALRFLAERAGVELPKTSSKDSAKREALQELYRRAAGSFQYWLFESKEAEQARRYLADRSIDTETQKSFQMGYAPQDHLWLYRFLHTKGYSDGFLREAGLFFEGRGGSGSTSRLVPMFRGRIMFPISNARGQVVAFGGRALTQNGPKYINSPESRIFKKGDNLFGLSQALSEIKKLGFFILVEGYTDTIALHQAGLGNCVAPLGTALTPSQARLLGRYASKGILFFDGDEAGANAMRRSISLMDDHGLAAEVAELQKGRDPADILHIEGPQTLHNVLKSSINGFQYLLNFAMAASDVQSPAGKEGVLRYLLPFVEQTTSEVKRESYISAIADALGVDSSTVRRDIVRSAASTAAASASAASATAAKPESESKGLTTDLFLMIAVAANFDYFSLVRRELSPENLEDLQARELYLSFEEAFRRGEDNIEGLLGNLESSELKRLVLERISSDEFSINQEKIINDSIKEIKRRSLMKKREQIALLLRKYEKNEPWKLKDLLVEKIVLDKEIEEIKVARDVGTTH